MPASDRKPRAWLLFRIGLCHHLRCGPLSVWALVEKPTAATLDIHDIRPGGLLRFSVARYRGAPLGLRDGTVVFPGDRLLELHLANDRLGRLGAAGVSPWRLLEQLRADLEALARTLEVGRLGDVRAVHGTTLLAAAGPRLGFELTEPRHTWSLRLHRFFFAGLVALHNPRGARALARKGRRWPGELWLSRAELLRRYGSGALAGSEPPAGPRRSVKEASPSPTSAIRTSLAAR